MSIRAFVGVNAFGIHFLSIIILRVKLSIPLHRLTTENVSSCYSDRAENKLGGITTDVRNFQTAVVRYKYVHIGFCNINGFFCEMRTQENYFYFTTLCMCYKNKKK